MLTRVIRDKALLEPVEFVAKTAAVYAVWRLLSYTGEQFPGFLWGGWAALYDLTGRLLATCDAALLRLLGVPHQHYYRTIIVDGATPIHFGNLCLGIAPMFIYTGIILVYGDNHKAKRWFIPLGVCCIFLINVLRLLALVLINAWYQPYFDLSHDYLYVAVTYGFIFILVMWWMNKWAFQPQASLPPAAYAPPNTRSYR